MLRRMFQNRVDVDNEYLLQHRVAGYPLYQYINMGRHGRLVDLYKDCTPCDEEEQKKRLKFIEKLETSMKEQEKEKQRDESQEESGEPVVYGHSEFAKSVYQQVAREHRRRKRWRQTDKTRVDDTLSEVIRRELKSYLYNDGEGMTVTKVEFLKWKQRWKANLSVSGISVATFLSNTNWKS